MRLLVCIIAGLTLAFPAPAQTPADDQQYLFSVLPLIQQGNLPEAERQLLEGVARYPRSAILQNALGIVYARQTKTDQAAAAFQRALEILPSFTAAQLQLATIRQQQGNQAEAAKWFRLAGEGTADPDALAAAGLGLADCEDYAGAAVILEKAHTVKPGDASVTYNLALAQYKNGRYPAALELLQSMGGGGQPPDVLYLHGKILERLGKPEGTSEIVAACQDQPANETFCRDAGTAAIRRQQYADAAAMLQSAVEKSPESPALLSLLGMAQFQLGRYREAIRSYTAALDRDPQIDASREGLGFLYYVTGDLEKARSVIEAGLKNPRADHYLFHLEAMVLYRTSPQLRPQALDSVNRSLKANPNFAPSYFLRGKIRMEQKDVPGALADFEHAVRLDPKYPLPYYKMAQIYTRLGREQQAAAARRKFSELGNLREEEVLARQTQDVLVPAAR